ncbi:hypothetical protein PENSPDRAFT_734854 [Peniophora sp. CONT]|nr:hypothetical protein PENSPDRAFT_734854 [Peniophora sp. CONT]
MLSRRCLPPIHKVSDDVLEVIFSFLVESYPSRPYDRYGYRANEHEQMGSLGWIVVTHVCRTWRRVGIEHAKLWADTITVLATSVKDIGPRTKEVPVVLDFRLQFIPDDYLYNHFLGAFLHRARVIRDTYEVAASWRESVMAYRVLSGKCLPSLERLELTYHPIELGFKDTKYATLAALMPFKFDAPSLTYAALTIFIPLVAPRLRVLIVGRDWIFTVPEMVAYLSTFPELEELRLRLKIIDVPTEAATGTPTVHLPRLRTFTNECDDFSIARLLQHISFPATTTVECYLGPKDKLDERDEHDFYALCRALSSQLHEGSRTQLIIDYDSAMHLSIAPRSDSLGESLDLPLQNGVTLGGGYELRLEGALATVASVVTRSVTSLAIRAFRPDELPVDLAELRKSFEKLVAVQELVVRHRAQRIFGALNRALFPALKQIVIDFKMSEWAENDTHDKYWFEYLCFMLNMRQQAKYTVVNTVVLRGTRMRRCEGASQCFVLTDKHLQYLKSLVGTVIDERV